MKWKDRAACRGLDHKLFFAEGPQEHYDTAKNVCRTCPVQTQCLKHAVNNSEPAGLWGGKSPRERRGILPSQRTSLLDGEITIEWTVLPTQDSESSTPDSGYTETL